MGYSNSLGWSFLPQKELDKKPVKTECHLWNSPQCGYGCGTCAGSEASAKYPGVFEQRPACSEPAIARSEPAIAQKGGAKEGNVDNWYSPQCNLANLGQQGCQDCKYYQNEQKVYRHMLKGALYPFCK